MQCRGLCDTDGIIFECQTGSKFEGQRATTGTQTDDHRLSGTQFAGDNFAEWLYIIWAPPLGRRVYREHAFVVAEQHADTAEAIRAVRESEVDPTQHELLLVNNNRQGSAWNLQLVPMRDLSEVHLTRLLVAWGHNQILSLDSSEE